MQQRTDVGTLEVVTESRCCLLTRNRGGGPGFYGAVAPSAVAPPVVVPRQIDAASFPQPTTDQRVATTTTTPLSTSSIGFGPSSIGIHPDHPRRGNGSMAPKVMLFAGAPASSTVDIASCTIHHFEKPFAQFMGVDHHPHNDASSAPPHATWRSLPLVKQPLHTGFSQSHQFQLQPTAPGGEADDTGFFTTADVTAAGYDDLTRSFEDAEDLLTQFCEQSLAVHNPLPSSQLSAADDTSLDDSTSFMTTTTSFAAPPPQPIIPCHLSDLEDIPPARQVLAFNPQTITVNLVVGIISLAQPRTVTTRWGRALSLVEVLVGDETKSGFGITFWLSSDSVSESQLRQLRRQDVVLMRNVALHVFRDKIYGQSLRRGLTQINLLWRRDGGGHYSTRALGKMQDSPVHPQMDKTKRVKDWVLNFVGGDRPSTRKAPRKSWDQPPDDTQ